MTTNSRSLIYWAPRVLAIAFIGFLGLFALDVFNEGLGWLGTARALAIHLVPSIALAIVLAVAWRQEWVGAAFFGLAGAYYIWTIALRHDLPAGVRVNRCGAIAGPALLIAILFWINWSMRGRAVAARP